MECEDEIALLKTIADEKCGLSGIWSQQECADASRKVIEQVDECLSCTRTWHPSTLQK